MVMQNLGGLLGGGRLNLGGLLGARAEKETQVPFMSHVGITDGDTLYNTMAKVVALIGALTDGSVFTKIWEKTVPAQQKIRWGYGSPATPHNQGYMWFCSMNVGGTFQVGVLRLVQAKARETVSYVVKELDDTRLHGTDITSLALATPTNINEMIALPEKVEFPKVAEDSLLQLWYRCVTASTVAEDAIGFSIPVTIYQ